MHIAYTDIHSPERPIHHPFIYTHHFPNSLRELKQVSIPHVPNIPRLETPYPPVYMRPSTHFILRELTQISISHVLNVRNVQRLETPYPPIYIRPHVHFILRVLTQISIPNVPGLDTPCSPVPNIMLCIKVVDMHHVYFKNKK